MVFAIEDAQEDIPVLIISIQIKHLQRVLRF